MHDELTEIDIKKMQEEINYRRLELTPKLLEQLQAARELGDLSENDEYRSAKREVNRNYSRIRYLENMIKTAVVIKVESKNDCVGLFDRVTIFYEEDEEERTVMIVTTLRSNVLEDCISKESPFGKALLGKKVGDRVTVKVNDTYSYTVKITNIEKGNDDESLKISTY